MSKMLKGGVNMFYELETVLTDILTIIMIVILYEIIRKVINNKRKGGVNKDE